MTSSISAQSATRARHRPVRREALPGVVASPARRSRARASACGRRRRSRRPGCGSSRRRRSPGRACRCPPRAPRAAPPLEPPGVRAVSCGLRVAPKSRFSVVGRDAHLGRVRLADQHGAGAAQARDAGGVAGGHVAGERARAVGRRIRRRVVQILGRERDAVQRAAPDVRQAVALARLGERALAVPGDDGADARILGLQPLERGAAGLLGRDARRSRRIPRAASSSRTRSCGRPGRAAAVHADHLLGRAERVEHAPPRWPARRPRRTGPCASTARSAAMP